MRITVVGTLAIVGAVTLLILLLSLLIPSHPDSPSHHGKP